MVFKSIASAVKQMLSEPFTMDFPESRESQPDNYRGIHKLDISTCISCAACAHICPNQCIDMVDTETQKGTKKMPEIHLERCLFCAFCEEVCPTDCLILTKDYDYEKYDRREFILRPEDQE
ncbi:MAG: 4Fe-4S dicluster domain-containing protein [Candidatus Marsarchaeota archaeon]|jgi:Formate hydrogenlyase subunit 6/NADH:ubiquinone oxidoreductase 23 kD subunit (chain I)|nr:4Fe-4S dicluster domain-containing protein [Candidatus Marsarchaeota archaeon]